MITMHQDEADDPILREGTCCKGSGSVVAFPSHDGNVTALIDTHFGRLSELYMEAGTPEISNAYVTAIVRAATGAQIQRHTPMLMYTEDAKNLDALFVPYYTSFAFLKDVMRYRKGLQAYAPIMRSSVPMPISKADYNLADIL